MQITTAMAVPALLSLHAITKSFGAVRALDGADLAIQAAEVLGLMGDNGAGKSTLTKIIAGNFPPTQGRIALNGAAVTLTGRPFTRTWRSRKTSSRRPPYSSVAR